MDQDTANALFEKGAVLLFLDAPVNMDFGIDYYSWTTGPRFKGLKLIPPGLHFFYYSALSKYGEGAVRTGFFKYFSSGEVLVKRWDSSSEDVSDQELTPDDVFRFKANIREFEPFLGVYPLTAEGNDPVSPYQKWLRLTTHVTPELIRRILPISGKVSAMTSISRFSEVKDDRPPFQSRGSASARGDSADVKAPPVAPVQEPSDSREALRLQFTAFDLKRSYPPGATGSDLTKYSLDKSYLLRQVLTEKYAGSYKELLGELQLSFLIFLLAEVYDGYEQWKALVHLICQSQDAVTEHGDTLFSSFIEIFHAQLEAHPTDFFHDVLSSDNFIRSNLAMFVKTIREDRTVSRSLLSRLEALLDFVEVRFKWDLRHEVQLLGEEDDEGEYAPVVVET
ncbi:a1-alpha2 repression [Gaertneriomyces sp. JEL0708]|nr:a1-alpha2 repression [Gaertneriomyces sp. JEL0708]